jgi:hypothetical protein
MKRVGRRILVMGADRWPITTARHNRHTTTAKVSFAHSTENTKELNETDAKGKWAREKETKGPAAIKKAIERLSSQ